ncbi:MAG: hypothetical protein M1816_006950 [Peltula sp. TS41687]|nr:MAG: hypothetical protein M1816_006950 [Peltula sp. TS41687]
MEVAPGPFLRTHTAPTHTRVLSQAHSNPLIPHRGHASLRAPYPQVPSTYPELPPSRPATADQPARDAPTAPQPGTVMASNNIINQVADSSKSLYQICVKLRQRLAEVPGFQRHLDEMEHEEAEDPMTAMWRCLKKGYPLLTVYNALNPATPIEIDPSKVSEAKRPKDAAFKFSEACKTHLKFPPDECFLIKDLHGDDTTGFVKVISAVNKVLDMLQERNLLLHSEVDNAPTAPETTRKKTRRDYIIAELVDTERKYVQDLEALQQFKLGVEEKGEVTGDKIHSIFLNLNALLDFQRRFLIRIETTNSLPEEQQNWGQIFIQSQDSFRVYEPYIANQQYADEQAMLEFDKLQKVGHGITSDRATLSGFLMKPFQRLSKYPLLLKELRDKCEAEDHIKEDLSAGMVAATSILERANAAIDKEQRLLAVEELQGQVEDWKGHDVEQFGELLLYGTFTVVKADGKNDDQRDYKIYLFERILLCCKELAPSKQKGNIMGLNRTAAEKKSKPKMLLKGRIFMQNVTETLSLQKPGSYTVQIFWKGEPSVENFVIRFNNEELMKRWYTQVEIQRKTYGDVQRVRQGTTRAGSTSDTEFSWSKNQGAPAQNPYKQEDDAEDDEDGPQQGTNHIAQSSFSISRNASNASLRSRPTTGDSGPPMPPMGTRVPPPRFPMGQIPAPALTLHTQLPGALPSPAERMAASYFSPTSESPMHPFPRQNTPVNHWHGDEPHRYTAPAMSRNASRDGPPTSNGYQTGGRNATRPSLPPMPAQGGAQSTFAQNRLRSASSPDIHNHAVPGRRPANADSSQPAIPDMPAPPFPHHVAVKKLPVNRSHNNSPMDVNYGVPMRSSTQSPGLQRERLVQASYTSHPQQYDPGSMLSPTSVAPPPTSAGAEVRKLSPPLTSPPVNDHLPTPTQLKVKVSFEDNYVTLVVGTNISYQSLVDRIDAKLSRFTGLAIGKGTIRLRYRDEDGDQVTIRSDEDIQIAFSDWKEQQRSQLMQGQLGEIQLFCQKIDG